MIHTQHATTLKRDEFTKPVFYCPYHKNKSNNTYFPFKREHIFRCNLEGCFCKNANGWWSNCAVCGRLVHNCVHGCQVGISIKWRECRDRLVPIIDPLEEHYNLYHLNQPVVLCFNGDVNTLSKNQIKRICTDPHLYFFCAKATPMVKTTSSSPSHLEDIEDQGLNSSENIERLTP